MMAPVKNIQYTETSAYISVSDTSKGIADAFNYGFKNPLIRKFG